MTIPTPPSPGQPVSATFFARLVAAVRSCLLVDGPGYRVRRGPNGTHLSLDLPAARRATAAALPGCFDLDGWEEDLSGLSAPTITRPYYRIGGRTHEVDSDSKDLKGAPSAWSESLLAVRINLANGSPAASYVRYNDLDELQNAELDMTAYIIPLYWFGEDGRSVAVDFRTAPNVQMTEV